MTIEEAKNIYAKVERSDSVAGLPDILTALGFTPIEGCEDCVITRSMFESIVENMHREDEDISVDGLADMLDFYSENGHV